MAAAFFFPFFCALFFFFFCYVWDTTLFCFLIVIVGCILSTALV